MLSVLYTVILTLLALSVVASIIILSALKLSGRKIEEGDEFIEKWFSFTFESEALQKFYVEVHFTNEKGPFPSPNPLAWVFFVDGQGLIFRDEPAWGQIVVRDEDWHEIRRCINAKLKTQGFQT